ncbi:hypothetical protein ACTQ54_03155 [Fundicoccus sp. Sow4_H7]|uniref:hypothetical protein n=1 Tax=Fundicoccus sp. Sow4_H7 TaxID=3438784 RepID=UPI003F923435
MSYEKSIKQFNRLRNAEVETLRFADPRHNQIKAGSGNLLGSSESFYSALRKAKESDITGRKRIELLTDLQGTDHKNFYSEAYEKSVKNLDELKQEINLAETIEEEQKELQIQIDQLTDKVSEHIKEAQELIQQIVLDTKEKVKPALNALSKIEQDENYLFHSDNKPLTLLFKGVSYYVPEVSPLLAKPVITNQGNRAISNRYTKTDVTKEILGGIK